MSATGPITTEAAIEAGASGAPPGRPLLSITIPTFHRAQYLAELLESLLPQMAALSPGMVEVFVFDNASPDATAEVVAGFRQRGLPCEYVRNATNIGADANFLQCLGRAAGKYVWIIGDDDVLVRGSLAGLVEMLAADEYDLVYLSTFGFHGKYAEGVLNDRLGRYAEVVTDPQYFLGKVSALIGLLSANIINKDRLLQTPHPPMESLVDTNLMQCGWLFPLLAQDKVKVLYIWRRLLGYRLFNSGGWGVCEVFGIRLNGIARRYFAAKPALADALMNSVLRRWLPDVIHEIRGSRHPGMQAEDFAGALRKLYAGNWRYWVFVYPVACLPLPLSTFAYWLLASVRDAFRLTGGVFRHWFRHGRYLAPSSGARIARQ